MKNNIKTPINQRVPLTAFPFNTSRLTDSENNILDSELLFFLCGIPNLMNAASVIKT